ncbi:hypothetical protein BHM03_00031195 [Ensete ventricosum]|nr:hypothetical protein BHM03_00031195 [Ensete ventricosum]
MEDARTDFCTWAGDSPTGDGRRRRRRAQIHGLARGGAVERALMMMMMVVVVVIVQEPLGHGVAELQSRERVAELGDLLVAETEAEVKAPLELLQVLVRQALRPRDADGSLVPATVGAVHVSLERQPDTLSRPRRLAPPSPPL